MPPRRSARRPGRYAVVLAGGYGTRFWPRSRQHLPKQFLPISGRRSLLQETVRRLNAAIPGVQLLVVAGAEFAPAIRRHLPDLPRSHLLIEPAKRGTAPCIAVAAAWIARRDPTALMGVFPADHVITRPARFRRAVARAFLTAARRRCLVAIGIRPAHPETGYGYIEGGEVLDPSPPHVRRVRRFHEKPDSATARAYVDGGRHLWNAGMFFWRVDVFTETLARLAPQIDAAMSLSARGRAAGVARQMGRAYRRLPNVSVDVAIMERADGVAVVEGDFGWNDVGSWAALVDVWGADTNNNTSRGPVLILDSRDTIIWGERRLVAVVGMEDVIVVDSPDALLVCRKHRAQDVRHVVDALARPRLRRYR